MFNGQSGRGLLNVHEFPGLLGDVSVGPELHRSGLLGIALPAQSPLSHIAPRIGSNGLSAGNSGLLAFMFPPLSDRHGNGDIVPAKDPLKCSGPSSSCELPGRKRANGIFRDLDNPPFRLCPQCFEKTYKRPGMGGDTQLNLPATSHGVDARGG